MVWEQTDANTNDQIRSLLRKDTQHHSLLLPDAIICSPQLICWFQLSKLDSHLSSNLLSNALSLPCSISSPCKLLAVCGEHHCRKAELDRVKGDGRGSCWTDSSSCSPHPSSTEGCCKRSAHLCHCIIMMIISSNNNNLDVKLLQHLVLMEAASNSSLAGSCVGPPASRCCLNLRQKPEAQTCEDQEMCWPLTGHTGNSMTAVNPLFWSHQGKERFNTFWTFCQEELMFKTDGLQWMVGLDDLSGPFQP